MKQYWLPAFALICLLATAQGQPAPAPQTNAVTPAPLEWGPGIKVLIMGGGYFHDFENFDNKFDADILNKAGITSVHYTEDSAVATSELPHADVMILSGNKVGFDTPQFRAALSNFAAAGKGIIWLHSGTWYTWVDWKEKNTLYVGGGATAHDSVGPFTETIVKQHPVTQGLPLTFKVSDELYHIVVDPAASPIEVLAEAAKPGGPKYPSVWLVHYGLARIVGIALGHNNFPREAPEFSKLLVNAVNWAGGH